MNLFTRYFRINLLATVIIFHTGQPGILFPAAVRVHSADGR